MLVERAVERQRGGHGRPLGLQAGQPPSGTRVGRQRRRGARQSLGALDHGQVVPRQRGPGVTEVGVEAERAEDHRLAALPRDRNQHGHGIQHGRLVQAEDQGGVHRGVFERGSHDPAESWAGPARVDGIPNEGERRQQGLDAGQRGFGQRRDAQTVTLEGVGDQESRPRLTGNDGESRLRCWWQTPALQNRCGLGELLGGLDDDGARLRKCRHCPVTRAHELSGVGYRELADIGSTDGKSNHGFAGRGTAHRRVQPSSVDDAFHVQRDTRGLRVVGEPLEQVSGVHVRRIAEPHCDRQPDIEPIQQKTDAQVDATGLGHNRNPPGPQSLDARHEGGDALERGVDEPGGVRSEHPQSGRPANLREALLSPQPLAADFAEAAGDNQDAADSRAGRLFGNTKARLRRDRENRQV